jgi:hypothetical protein
MLEIFGGFTEGPPDDVEHEGAVVNEFEADVGTWEPVEAAAELFGDGEPVLVGAVAEFMDPHPSVRYL